MMPKIWMSHMVLMSDNAPWYGSSSLHKAWYPPRNTLEKNRSIKARDGSLMYKAKKDGRVAMILCNMMVVNLRRERCT